MKGTNGRGPLQADAEPGAAEEREPAGAAAPAGIQALLVLQALPEALDRLPREQRRAIIWRFYENRCLEEIASRLQTNPEAAGSLLQAGLRRLKARVGPPPGGR